MDHIDNVPKDRQPTSQARGRFAESVGFKVSRQILGQWRIVFHNTINDTVSIDGIFGWTILRPVVGKAHPVSRLLWARFVDFLTSLAYQADDFFKLGKVPH